MRRLCVLALLVLLPIQSGSAATSEPAARVGAVYFDGWACPLSNFHFNGLVDGPYTGRQPLYGWRDNSRESMRTQLTWAHQDGIGFFLFDWYRENVDPCLNVAHDNYLALRDHHGVGFALLYVNHDPFGVSPAEWPAFAEQWVTNDFSNPDYEKVDGKPLFVVYDTTLFRQQQGGTAGVNAALEELRAAARQHGLPGVFVVGGRYTDWLNIGCFPACEATDGGPGGLPLEHYDALSEYASLGAAVPSDGARPYGDLVAATKAEWDRYAEASRIPWIPSVTDGWDPRPWDEQPYGNLFWFTRTPEQVAAFVREAIGWVQAHPSMQVGASSTPPLVLLEAWNELGEGGYVLATKEDGYAYGTALAGALGLPWSTVHARRVTVSAANGVLTGTVQVLDDWTPCDVASVRIERRVHGAWTRMRTEQTRPGGAYSIRLPHRRAVYRAVLSQTLRYRQTCAHASSAAVRG